MAQNRLTQEMIAQIVVTIFAIIACLIGLNWGLEGVSYGYLATTVLGTVYSYVLVYKTIPTRLTDLFNALSPGLLLNALLFLVLAFVDSFTGELYKTDPAFYTLFLVIPGVLVYLAAFLFLPIMALKSEAALWREKINSGLSLVYKFKP